MKDGDIYWLGIFVLHTDFYFLLHSIPSNKIMNKENQVIISYQHPSYSFYKNEIQYCKYFKIYTTVFNVAFNKFTSSSLICN